MFVKKLIILCCLFLPAYATAEELSYNTRKGSVFLGFFMPLSSFDNGEGLEMDFKNGLHVGGKVVWLKPSGLGYGLFLEGIFFSTKDTIIIVSGWDHTAWISFTNILGGGLLTWEKNIEKFTLYCTGKVGGAYTERILYISIPNDNEEKTEFDLMLGLEVGSRYRVSDFAELDLGLKYTMNSIELENGNNIDLGGFTISLGVAGSF